MPPTWFPRRRFQAFRFTIPMLLTRRACLALPMVLGLTPSVGQVSSPGVEPVRIALIEGLSGPFANAGEAVFRNLLWAVERINERGGVRLPGGAAPWPCCGWTARATPKRPCRCCAVRWTSAALHRAGQQLGRGGGPDRCAGQAQRSRPAAARAAAQLLGRRSRAHQRALQLLALPLRRPRRHAAGRAGRRAARRPRAAQRLPDRPGLQLRPAGGAPRAPAAGQPAAGRCASSATSFTPWAASRTSCPMRPRSRPAAHRPCSRATGATT
jgi:hypothetical protein